MSPSRQREKGKYRLVLPPPAVRAYMSALVHDAKGSVMQNWQNSVGLNKVNFMLGMLEGGYAGGSLLWE